MLVGDGGRFNRVELIPAPHELMLHQDRLHKPTTERTEVSRDVPQSSRSPPGLCWDCMPACMGAGRGCVRSHFEVWREVRCVLCWEGLGQPCTVLSSPCHGKPIRWSVCQPESLSRAPSQLAMDLQCDGKWNICNKPRRVWGYLLPSQK